MLVICSSRHQYEAITLARSIDAACDIVPVWPAYTAQENTSAPELNHLLRHYLGTRRYQVIAVAGVRLGALPDDCEAYIAELIQQQGVGLIYAMPDFKPDVPSPVLDPLLPLAFDRTGYKPESRQVMSVGDHPLSRGCDFAAMSWRCTADAQATPGGTVVLQGELPNRALAGVAVRGKGRVVAYNWCYAGYGSNAPFLPRLDDAGKPAVWMRGYAAADQFYSWLGRALLWAAQCEPEPAITQVAINGQTATITVRNTSAREHVVNVQATACAPFNSAKRQVVKPITVPAGAERKLAITLPDAGFLGRHVLDLALTEALGRVIDWATTPYAVAGALRVEHTLDDTLYTRDREVAIPITVTAASKTGTAQVKLYDLDGRLLHNRTTPLTLTAGAPTAVTLQLPLHDTGITSRLGNLQVLVRAAGETVEVHDQLFIRQDPAWDQFHIVAYHGVDALPQTHVIGNVLKAMGHDTLPSSYGQPERSWYTVESGFRSFALWTAWMGCPPEKIREFTRMLRNFSPVLYEMQDEPELQFTPAVEARWTAPVDMARFHNSLQTTYTSLDALNADWGTAYTEWSAVQRPLWHEVYTSDSWAPWFASRRDLDRKMTDTFAGNAAQIQAEDPGAHCSINPRAVDTLAGTDVAALGRALGGLSLYTFFTARAPMGYLEYGAQWCDILQSYIGYTWPSNPNLPQMRREAWTATRLGVNHLGWFAPSVDEAPPHGRYGYLEGDLIPNAKGEAIAEINRLLLSGPGDLAVNTDPLREGIFIYYPRTAIYTTTLAHLQRQLDGNPALDPKTLKGLGPWTEQLPCAFVPLLQALGYQYEIGDEMDLTRERLQRTRVVLLSHVVCLGERELALLAEFERNGGVVIAEAGTARRDADGRLYAQTPPAFRELFGLTRSTPNRSPIIGKDTVEFAGADVVSGVPATLGLAYRKGRAYFLNFPVPPTFDACMVLRGMLEACGVQPTYALVDNYISYDHNNRIASLGVRTRGELSYLYLTGDGNHRDSAFAIDLPGPRQVYDVLTGQHLGTLTRISGQVQYGDVRLYALSPTPITRFTAIPSAGKATCGERVTIRFTLQAQGGQVGDRLVTLELQGSRPGVLPPLPRTLMLPEGTGELVLHLPLNCTIGELHLTATDLTSGARCQTTITVQSR
jgi:hypothetical protein